MTNNTLDKAIVAVPKFGDRISLFTKKLRIAQYAARCAACAESKDEEVISCVFCLICGII